jgi:hypothetical protein
VYIVYITLHIQERTQMTLINSEMPSPQSEALTKAKVKAKPSKTREDLLAELLAKVESTKAQIALSARKQLEKNTKSIQNLLADEKLCDLDIVIWKLAIPKIKIALAESKTKLAI